MAIDKPLTRVNFLGDIAYGDVRINVSSNSKKRLNFRNPLIMNQGKGGDYEGENSDAAESVNFKTISLTTPTTRFEEFNVQIATSGALEAAALAAATTLDVGVDFATQLRPQQTLHFPDKGENVRITAITQPIDGTVTVERAVGSQVADPRNVHPAGFTRTTAQDLDLGEEFVIAGSAVVDYSTARETRGYNALEIREAATQINRSDIPISRRRKVQQQSNKSKQVMWEERQKQELFYIMQEIEHMMLFSNMIAEHGGRINVAGNDIAPSSGDYTTSDGIFSVVEKYAPANILAANDAELNDTGNSLISKKKLNALTEILDRVGGDHTILTSAALMEQLNDVLTDPTLTHNNIEFEGNGDTIGKRIRKYVGTFGTLKFQHHPLLDKATKYQKTMLCIRDENLGILGLKGEELKWNPNSQENDRMGESGYYSADLGLGFAYAKEAYIINEWDIS